MSLEENTVISFPTPDSVLTEKPSIKKYLKYLLFFGPGAVLASMTIGQGQLILGPQIGAWSGYGLIWLITVNISSYVIAYISIRFTMVSGISFMDIFALKTRKGWFNWLIIVIMAIFIPMFTASIITTLGQSLAWILGLPYETYLILGIFTCLIAGLLVIFGRYRFLENVQAFFVVVLAAGAVISAFFIIQKFNPDVFEIIASFFAVGNAPSYPSWVPLESSRTPAPLLMMGYLGTLTVTLIPLVGYIGWIKVKRWGIFKDKTNPESFGEERFLFFKKSGKISYLPNDESEVKKCKKLLRPLQIDLSLAFIVVSIVSASYILAGKFLLGYQEDGSILLPTDIDLVKTQAVIFTQFSDWLEPLYKISVFFALFGTVYAGFEAATRMLFETSKHLIKRVNNIYYKRFMIYIMILILASGIPISLLMYYGLSVLLILSLTLLFIGVVSVIIFGVGSIYMTQKILPEKYKLNGLGLILAIGFLLLFTIPLIIIFL
ncbi:MAG: Nramp family divalent metal transporter [Candidatus Thermoplasmatota archaeon]|nr:Nramp family divalent metal transporter [Candidatus Thermoplasmatota archaeon]